MTLQALAGLLVLNVGLLVVGGAVLWAVGGWRSWSDLVRLSGVAYLVGVASFMVAATLAVVVGVPLGGGTMLAIAVAVAAAGVASGLVLGRGRPSLAAGDLRLPGLSIVSALFLAGVVALVLGSFRAARLSSLAGEWDSWAFWIPRAELLYFFGELDQALTALMPVTSQSYPPGLTAVYAGGFHAMGSADGVTLHLQAWCLVAGAVAAFIGLLGPRVRPLILFPALLAVLVMPSLVERMTSTYADVPLGVLVATAAVLVVLWLDERQGWQLASAAILMSGAMLTKREGLLFVACLVLTAFVASWGSRRVLWPRLGGAAAVALALALPWRVWFTNRGLPSDGPDAGYIGAFDHLARVRPSTELVFETLFDVDLWNVVPLLSVVAIVLAALAGARTVAVFAGVFAVTTVAAAIWVNWSNPSLPFSQEDHENPVVRLLGTPVLALGALMPLLLERAWSGSTPSVLGGLGATLARRARVLVTPGLLPWAIVAATVLAYPISALVGYDGKTLPGGWPAFPHVHGGIDRAYAVIGRLREPLGVDLTRDEGGRLRLSLGGAAESLWARTSAEMLRADTFEPTPELRAKPSP